MLLTDILLNLKPFLRDIGSFFVHRLQLVDIKGLKDFLKSDFRSAGKNEYGHLAEIIAYYMPKVFEKRRSLVDDDEAMNGEEKEEHV